MIDEVKRRGGGVFILRFSLGSGGEGEGGYTIRLYLQYLYDISLLID